MRAASSAASFTRFARSAPEKPGVPRAITFGSTSDASGTLRMCTRRIFSRPFTSGFGTTTWRSKRPGRSSAGSSTSGRLVAAIRMTPSLLSKPSISTSIWFSVCSRSSLPPPRPAPRCRPTASISSMKMMQGAFFLPCSNMSRTRRRADADEHLDEVGTGDGEERHVRLAGDGARQQRLAGAGRADQQHALAGSCRRGAGTSAGPSGTRRSPAVRPSPRRCRRRRRTSRGPASRSACARATCRSPWPGRRPPASGA